MFRSVLKALGRGKIALFAAIFTLGIIFILLSEYTATGKEAFDPGFDESDYAAKLEDRLEAILTRVEGVSEPEVMITLAGSATVRYETGTAKRIAADGNSQLPVLSESLSGDNEPVLASVSAPEIKGVSVVCKGANNAVLRQKVIGLIAAALHLSPNRIYVTE